MAERFQFLSHLVLESKVLVETFDRADPLWHWAIPLKPGCNTVIGKLGTITDYRFVDVRTLKGSTPAENHFNNDGKAVGFKTERGQIRGEFLGQHWKDLGNRID